jgi:hypothetical protein
VANRAQPETIDEQCIRRLSGDNTHGKHRDSDEGNGDGLGSHEESAQQPGGDSPPGEASFPHCCRNSTKPIAHAPRHKQANREQSEARAEGDERRLDTGSSVPSQFTIHPSLSGGNEPTENQEYEE